MRFKMVLGLLLAFIMVSPCASASLRFDSEYETKELEIDIQNDVSGLNVNVLDYYNVNNWNNTIRPLQEENEEFRGISHYCFQFPQKVRLNRSIGSPTAWGENYTFSFPYLPDHNLVFDGHSDAWLRLPVNNLNLGSNDTHEIRLAVYKPYIDAYNISLNESIDNITLNSGEHGDTPGIKIYDDIVYTNRNLTDQGLPSGILDYTYQDNRSIYWNSTQNNITTPQSIDYNFTYIRVSTPLYKNTIYVFVVQLTTKAATYPRYEMLYSSGDYNNDLILRSDLYYDGNQTRVQVDLDTPLIITDMVSGPSYSVGFEDYAEHTEYVFQYFMNKSVTPADNITIQMPVYALEGGNIAVAVGISDSIDGPTTVLSPGSLFLESFQSFEDTFPPPGYSQSGTEWVQNADPTAPDGLFTAHIAGPFPGPERFNSPVFDTTDIDSLQIDFSFYVTGFADADDFRMYFVNETGVGIEAADFDGFPSDVWTKFSTTITDTQYFHDGFYIYIEAGTGVVGGEEFSFDALYANVTSGQNTFKRLSPGYNTVTFTNLINDTMDVKRVGIVVNSSNGFDSKIGFYLAQTEGIEGRTTIKDRDNSTHLYRTNAPALCRLLISETTISLIPLEQLRVYVVPKPDDYEGSLAFIDYANREWHMIQQGTVSFVDQLGTTIRVVLSLSVAVGLILIGTSTYIATGGNILLTAKTVSFAAYMLEQTITGVWKMAMGAAARIGEAIDWFSEFLWGVIEFVVNAISWLITYGIHFFAIYIVICVYLMSAYCANGICSSIVQGIKKSGRNETINFRVFDKVLGNTWDFFARVLSLNMAIGGFMFSLLLVILKLITGV